MTRIYFQKLQYSMLQSGIIIFKNIFSIRLPSPCAPLRRLPRAPLAKLNCCPVVNARNCHCIVSKIPRCIRLKVVFYHPQKFTNLKTVCFDGASHPFLFPCPKRISYSNPRYRPNLPSTFTCHYLNTLIPQTTQPLQWNLSLLKIFFLLQYHVNFFLHYCD